MANAQTQTLQCCGETRDFQKIKCDLILLQFRLLAPNVWVGKKNCLFQLANISLKWIYYLTQSLIRNWNLSVYHQHLVSMWNSEKSWRNIILRLIKDEINKASSCTQTFGLLCLFKTFFSCCYCCCCCFLLSSKPIILC